MRSFDLEGGSMRTYWLPLFATLIVGCGSNDSPPVQQDAGPSPDAPDGGPVGNPDPVKFSFFITNTGNPNGGDFRRTPADTDGLAGADAFCQASATRGVPASASRQWRAYLSTSTVNAKDRIGAGPWYNFKGDMIAASVETLLEPTSNMINKANSLTETGQSVPGFGDSPNQHDILTGTADDGTSSGMNCNNWTSSDAAAFTATLGHSDRMGTNAPPASMSWSSAHLSRGCAVASFPPTGGRGSIYCFAAD
jgi:hypothetical protein